MNAPTRPVLRWHGGKWKLAPWIISQFPEHKVYVEPFGGAASVLLRKSPVKSEVYNDLDGDVVCLFRVLRDADSGARLIAALRHTPFAREEFDGAYVATDEPIERARRLIIRSLMGFGTNGHARRTGFRCKGYRAGQLPQHDWGTYADALPAVIERLRAGVVIESDDALAVMARYDEPDCLHYVDPPYVAETRDPGRDYRHELSSQDHSRLLEVLCDLAGMVVLSGYADPLYDNALKGWRRVETKTFADGARERTEVLWINPACAAALDARAAGACSPLFQFGVPV
ncbi:DNA adenine methylase [Mesorhizobium sp. M8A.F.Ca.ET.208.01.1.1]|uniref:DNA adenine methylase n=1 Tax=unclassified Mesorhizobium TaxID=325217 RepID=UPI0010933CC5|nr:MULTISPECIES: DNA adenine methylase [unclassified Mesorhizobium]TGQ95397.1 DNA adenine methylase [Mesorhizobium sp. M8A.F.Ca.ET.208.01.1.1]TGT55888.1 DNA adenine methylase [Mesorhizobium sp. M8A.F.Ca.ET.167.01.1.1]